MRIVIGFTGYYFESSFYCTLGACKETRKRVLIVGAGAAGTAAAYSLGKNRERFDVQIWERGSVPGTYY